MSYKPTIGLEIHAELRTQTKMFCRSKNDPDESRPNVNVCPVCLAHPGTLPVINREAVRHVLRVGTALKGKLADYTEFDRKNYFYPDLPKGYQISQFEYPLVSGGELAGVPITRVHLEEDTASSVHDDATGATTIDYNRGGVPLMELVTEPAITSAEQAGVFARELQLLLRYLGASEANMEKGEMRVEANVSVSADEKLGTKVEIKNLNSFRAMERAVAYEIQRQIEALEKGERVIQETRGWNEKTQATFSQRVKEGSADYRYFPDPDLPSLTLSEFPEFSGESLRAGMPELPSQRRERYLVLGLKQEDADTFVRDIRFGTRIDEISVLYAGDTSRIASAANYLANDIVKLVRDLEEKNGKAYEELPLSAKKMKAIVDLAADKKISSRVAKDLLAEVVKSNIDPETYARENNLLQTASSADLSSVVQGIIATNPTVVADYKAGKTSALEYLLGQAMKQLRGAGDPGTLRDLFRNQIV